jgi:guanylate kinase
MRGASDEIRHWIEYDYVVINHEVERSVQAVRAILTAERVRRSRLTGLKSFVYNLLSTP